MIALFSSLPNTFTKFCATGLVASSLTLGLGLSGCSDDPAPAPNVPKPTTTAKKDAKKENNEKTGMYDFDTWKEAPIAVNTANTAGLLGLIGITQGTNQPTKDFFGGDALIQKLRGNELVFFNLIDSNDFVEINWFKASDSDNDDIKNLSVANAEKAYKVARALLNDTGGDVVKDIMTAKDGKTSITHGRLAVANCEAFFCRMVVSKQDSVALVKTTIVNGATVNDADANIPDEPEDAKPTTESEENAAESASSDPNSDITTG